MKRCMLKDCKQKDYKNATFHFLAILRNNTKGGDGAASFYTSLKFFY